MNTYRVTLATELTVEVEVNGETTSHAEDLASEIAAEFNHRIRTLRRDSRIAEVATHVDGIDHTQRLS